MVAINGPSSFNPCCSSSVIYGIKQCAKIKLDFTKKANLSRFRTLFENPKFGFDKPWKKRGSEIKQSLTTKTIKPKPVWNIKQPKHAKRNLFGYMVWSLTKLKAKFKPSWSKPSTFAWTFWVLVRSSAMYLRELMKALKNKSNLVHFTN